MDPTFKSEMGETLRRLGIDPEGRLDPVEIMKKMKEKMGEGSLSYRDVAQVNRLVRETVLEVDAMRHHGQSRLGASGSAHALQGVTVHGGEQVRGSVLLKTLISDLQVIVAAGADRIGHGVILGLPFVTEKGKINTALLEHLGFEWNEKAGVWQREHGSSFETLSHTEIIEMERARRGLLRTISDNGVVIEINPSSNIIISGLDPTNHPIKQMLHDAPYLRFSVNTDNPGIHLTDVSSEMAHLYATGALTWPQTVRGALEGFGSRLGSRPLPEALALRQRTEDAIVRGTKPHERRAVIDELSRRHPHLPQELGDVSSDEAFRKALDPYLKKTFQIPDKGRKTLGS
jgi:hypothetical protein